ncbi:MAG: glycosyltransferase family 2 protein [Prevotellaceae bacterium]|jgi:cellulose synthase/poly-beta-1,6-N-acetylglucosamine synthase-like glycosyltransferase|nr:glycosyltransferase family 2 protein [Prevotellaceae bacterium]
MIVLEIIFWVGLCTVFYTYVGYGALLYLLVKLKECFRKPVQYPLPEDAALPPVTLFIAAYNEELVVDEKMRNTLALDYPADKLRVLWVTDGSNDATNQRLQNWPQATVLHQPERQGKTAALNRGMTYVETPLVVFTDANTHLNSQAIRHIVATFADPRVGCVAGEKRIAVQEKENAASGGEGFYWKYESTLKALDTRLYSAVGAAGELFAVRRELFEPMPVDTLLDDFVLSLRIAMKGFLIAYCAQAYAVESGSADMHEEEKRKVRIAAGGLQSVWRLRALLLRPFRYRWLWFEYVSHRVLRWSVTPVLLFLLLPLNAALLVLSDRECSRLYLVLLLLQLLFYAAGMYGRLLAGKNIKNKVLFIPYYFLFMNLNVIKGFAYLHKRKTSRNGAWEKAKRAN